MANEKSPVVMELEKRVPIDDYFNKYLQPANKRLNIISEANPRSCCPFHDEKDPSFAYWASKKRFHCFGCGVSGDIVRLHQLRSFYYEHRRLTNEEAANELIGMYQLYDIPEAVAKQEEVTGPAGKIRAIRKKVIETYDSGFSNEALTLARYEKMQNNIAGVTDMDSQVKMYNELDMMTCLVMARVVDND